MISCDSVLEYFKGMPDKTPQRKVKHPRRRSTQRGLMALNEARTLLQTITESDCDLLLTYGQLYGIYLKDSGMVEELKPLFRLPGFSVDSLSLNDQVRSTIKAAATQWLKDNPA
jgi:hypothetical protein